MARSLSGPRRGTGFFDLAVAALAGGAAAFATFAMPDALFAQFVVASRLPELLPAAQPPLGETARWAAVAAAGVATAFLVWALLRALDRVPAPSHSQAAAAPFAEAPRVRRADAHPDAPARRPLRAGRELGEPCDEAPPADETLELVEEAPEERFADLVPQPLPGFLVPQDREEIAETEEPPHSGESLETLSASVPQPEKEGGGTSIGDLMQRLESGLSRRERQPVEEAAAPPVIAAPPEVPQPAPAPAKPPRMPLDLSPQPAAEPVAPAEDRVGHRLRSAINDLQKLSGHG